MDYKIYNTINEIESSGKRGEKIREELYALWRECFNDTKSYTDFYFNWKVKDNRILTAYKQERLSAMLHLNPYSVMVGGKPEPLNYIVGVATRQQDRRQGLMKMLLGASLNQMYEEHRPFTYLMPAAEAIYLPFGFRTVYEQEPWKQQLMEAGKRNDGTDFSNKNVPREIKVTAVESTDEEKISQITVFTNGYLKEHYDIYTERTSYYYKRIIHEMKSAKGGVLLCSRGKETIGYVSYMTDGGLGIAECIYKKEEKEGFMDAVSGQIIYEISNTDANHKNPSIMVRIVDLESFLKNISAKENVTLYMKAEDNIIRQNNGVFRLQFTNRGCRIMKTGKPPDIVTDIADMAGLFFGKLTKKETAGLIAGQNSGEILDKINKINVYQKLFINDVT